MLERRVVVPLDGGPPALAPRAPLDAARRLALRNLKDVWGRLVEEVEDVGRELEAAMVDQLQALQDQLRGELRRENDELRARLAAAEASLLARPQDGSFEGRNWPEANGSRTSVVVRLADASEVVPAHCWAEGSGGDPAAEVPAAGGQGAGAWAAALRRSAGEVQAKARADSGAKDAVGGAGPRCDSEAMGETMTFGRTVEFDPSMGEETSGKSPQCEPANICSMTNMGTVSSTRSSWRRAAEVAHQSEATSEVQMAKLESIVKSQTFETVFAAFILLNCASMGLEAHERAAGGRGQHLDVILENSEHIFTAVFTMEFLLRLRVYGLRGFRPSDADGRFNMVDGMLVLVTGILFTWVIPFFVWMAGGSIGKGPMQSLTILRVMRLARLVRVFRHVALFHEAWVLIRGLRDSCRTLFWTCVVIFFVTYVFAIFGLVLLVPPLEQARAEVTEAEAAKAINNLMQMLGGIDRLMFTLIQVMIQDGFHAIMRDLMHFVPWCWLYFYAYVAVACFVLMNLVTAIIVENAMSTSRIDNDQAAQEKEAKKKKFLGELQRLFVLMDADGNGTLCWKEFREAFEDPLISKKWMVLDFEPDECKELFDLLDDGDGEIGANEFFEGLHRMKGGAQAKDVYRLETCIHKLMISVEDLASVQGHAVARPRHLSRSGTEGSQRSCADLS